MNNLEIKITATVIKNKKVLLIKEINTDNNQYYWNLIKGTFDPAIDESILILSTENAEKKPISKSES